VSPKRTIAVMVLSALMLVFASHPAVSQAGCGSVEDCELGGCETNLEGFIPCPEFYKERVHWSGGDALNVVFLPDGFEEEDLETFATKVNDAIAAVFESYPFQSCAFNFYRGDIASTDTGIDNGSYGSCQNTRFNTSYGDPCCVDDTTDDVPERCVYTRTPGFAIDAAQCVMNEFGGSWDIIFVLVNDTKYGACVLPWAGAFGMEQGILFAAVDAEDYELTIAHELGHLVGPLEDEYVLEWLKTTAYSGSDHQYYDNVTVDPEDLTEVWADNLTVTGVPVDPESYSDDEVLRGVVGRFEGAAWYGTGIYRPQWKCRMNLELSDPFCLVCGSELVERMEPLCPPGTFVGGGEDDDDDDDSGGWVDGGVLGETFMMAWWEAKNILWHVDWLAEDEDTIAYVLTAQVCTWVYITDPKYEIAAELLAELLPPLPDLSKFVGFFVVEPFEQYYLRMRVPAPTAGPTTLTIGARMFVNGVEITLPP
jgi:hypothetical protein